MSPLNTGMLLCGFHPSSYSSFLRLFTSLLLVCAAILNIFFFFVEFEHPPWWCLRPEDWCPLHCHHVNHSFITFTAPSSGWLGCKTENNTHKPSCSIKPTFHVDQETQVCARGVGEGKNLCILGRSRSAFSGPRSRGPGPDLDLNLVTQSRRSLSACAAER